LRWIAVALVVAGTLMGTYVFPVLVSPVPLLVLAGRDLTEHKKLETDLRERTEQVTAINEMLKVSSAQMAQREKMVALGHMAAGIAHEISSPFRRGRAFLRKPQCLFRMSLPGRRHQP